MFSSGYILSVFKKEEIKILADLIIYVTAPALFITSITLSKFEAGEIAIIFFTAATVIISGIALVYLIRKKKKLPLGMYYPIAFMNTGFLGVPIVLISYGIKGLAYAVIYDATLALFAFSLGIYIISERRDKWEVFKIPFIYTAALGILLNIYNIEIPFPVFKGLSMLGSATIPLALIMLGYRIGNIRISSLKLPLFGAILRGGIGFVVAFVIIRIFNISGILANVLIIMSILPSAITSIVFCEKYGCREDCDLVASTIAISMLASLFYLPIAMYLLK